MFKLVQWKFCLRLWPYDQDQVISTVVRREIAVGSTVLSIWRLQTSASRTHIGPTSTVNSAEHRSVFLMACLAHLWELENNTINNNECHLRSPEN